MRTVRVVQPPERRLLTQSEAIRSGQAYCYDRGYKCNFRSADFDRRDGTWMVTFNQVLRGRKNARLDLEIDARSGRLVQVGTKGRAYRRG